MDGSGLFGDIDRTVAQPLAGAVRRLVASSRKAPDSHLIAGASERREGKRRDSRWHDEVRGAHLAQ
jgi:hypothetical protein